MKQVIMTLEQERLRVIDGLEHTGRYWTKIPDWYQKIHAKQKKYKKDLEKAITILNDYK